MSTPQLCGAKTRAGGTCKKPAMIAQARCSLHGGKTPSALAAAQHRLAEQAARRTLADLGEVVPVTDPVGAL